MITPASTRWASLALALLVLLPLCLTAGSNAQAQRISLLRDAEIEQFLQDYSHPLFAAAGLDPAAVEIYLVGDPSLNAFVTNGLKMFIHTGLITSADTPNQIEGVIAHEAGHLAGGHQQRGAEAMAAASRPAMLSLVLGAAAIAAGAPEAGMGIMGLGQTIGLAEYLSYSRGQEAAADQAAVSYLETVGSSGQGLVEFFDKISNRQLLSARRPDPYFQTHPLALQRMVSLRERVEAQSHFEVADSEEEILRLKMIQAKIHGFMQDTMVTLRQYPLQDQSKPARYARAVAYYRSSQLDKALREVDRLIEEEPENPFFEELKGQMLFEHGKVREALAPHRRAMELAPQYALLRINLARALIALETQEEVKEAIDVLKIALQIEPDNGFGWSQMARGYSYIGREEMANLAQAQAFFAWGNLAEAHRFASRARGQLEVGSPEHLQALDIIAASEETAREARRSNNNRR